MASDHAYRSGIGSTITGCLDCGVMEAEHPKPTPDPIEKAAEDIAIRSLYMPTKPMVERLTSAIVKLVREQREKDRMSVVMGWKEVECRLWLAVINGRLQDIGCKSEEAQLTEARAEVERLTEFLTEALPSVERAEKVEAALAVTDRLRLRLMDTVSELRGMVAARDALGKRLAEFLYRGTYEPAGRYSELVIEARTLGWLPEEK